MNIIRLAGCRADTLLGYLKAVALLRLLGLQRDRNVRGAWNGETFELSASFDRAELERFLLQDYAPLPVLNPWNSGAGFDGKQDKAASIVDQLRKTQHARWADYRAAIELIDDEIVGRGMRERLPKEDIVRFLRANYSDEALPWLDAAIVIGRDGAAFPYLLGSGGNDGRLDFSVNFAARALDVIGDAPLSEREQLLRDALDDTSKAKLIGDAAIGQFGPRFAGGVNGTSGFDAASLVNPWDLVLALEGAVSFGGGLTKRLPSTGERVSFPFAFGSTAAGYTSASSEESARGEMWLPVWDGAATFSGVSAMLRAGRADLPSTGEQPQVRTAVNAVQAVQAALTLGAGLGIGRFERIAFVQRNGLAYTGAHSGTVFTGNDPGIALLSRGAAAWVERVRSRSERLGKSVRDALHGFDTALFTYARIAQPQREGQTRRTARACADVLIGLADIDFAIARRGHEDLRPLEYLDTAVLRLVDDGSLEHRIALALMSLSFSRRYSERELRLNLEHVRYGDRGQLEYRPDAKISYSLSIKNMLGDICERRVMAAAAGDIAWLRGTAGLGAPDIASLANGERTLDQHRLGDLLRAYSLVRSPAFVPEVDESAAVSSDEAIPAAFALLKLVLDHPRACDRRIVALLRARDPSRALALALERARGITDLPAAPRSVAAAHIPDPLWYASAALVPIRLTPMAYAPLLGAALSRRFDLSYPPARRAVSDYLGSIRKEKEEAS